MSLKNKVAVVTGASKGIGAAIAERLAADGASVIVNYVRDAKGAEALVAKIHKKGGKAKAVQGDVAKPAESKALIDAAAREFGPVDILVNNAGVFEFRPLADVDEEHFDRQYNINVKGLLFATQAAVNAFGDRGGSVINISSVVSTSPAPNGSVYSSTKSAVDGLTKALAAELGPKKIRVNSVLPGVTITEGFEAMPAAAEFKKWAETTTPFGRAGQPSEIASVVSFLASDDAGWVTGQQLAAAGGLR